MNKCDDCERTYPGTPYYTFDPEGCEDEVVTEVRQGVYLRETVSHRDCTGNLCPECAGPFLEPDDPDDDRAKVAQLVSLVQRKLLESAE